MYTFYMAVPSSYSIRILTLMQLKVYASTLSVRESWSQQDYQNKGYIITNEYKNPVIVYTMYSTVLGLITALLVFLLPEWYRKATIQVERGDQWYSFFWALSFVATLCNAAVIICEFRGISTFRINLIVFPLMLVVIVLDLIIASVIRKDPAFPIPKALTFLTLFCTCCCCWSVTSRLKLAQTLALWNLLTFIHFVTISTLPTILWMFVLPIQILAVTALLVTTVFFATALIALVIKDTPVLYRRITCRGSWRALLPMVSIGLFLALVIQASVFYIKLTNTGVDQNNLSKFIASFIPSATLTIVGWFVTNKVFNSPDKSNQNERASGTAIQRAEEDQNEETRSDQDTHCFRIGIYTITFKPTWSHSI